MYARMANERRWIDVVLGLFDVEYLQMKWKETSLYLTRLEGEETAFEHGVEHELYQHSLTQPEQLAHDAGIHDKLH